MTMMMLQWQRPCKHAADLSLAMEKDAGV